MYCMSITIPFSFVYTQTAAPSHINSALESFAQPTGVKNQTVPDAVGGGLAVAYQVVGLLFFILAVYAGILWMTAEGKEETITKARNILLAATIGMLVIVSAYTFTTFITNRTSQTFSTSVRGPINSQIPSDNPDSADTVTPDGVIQTNTQGCCVQRLQERGRVFGAKLTTLQECENSVRETNIGLDKGFGTSNDDDWQFYIKINIAESCQLMKGCWELGTATRRTRCISNIEQ